MVQCLQVPTKVACARFANIACCEYPGVYSVVTESLGYYDGKAAKLLCRQAKLLCPKIVWADLPTMMLLIERLGLVE